MKFYLRLIFLLYFVHWTVAVRPAYENDEELCPFTNRIAVNNMPSEMTPRIPGMKYFRRTNESREPMNADRARSICKMYNLEAAEILDHDDYNEAIAIVRETGWSFWIAVKGKLNPDFGNYFFDFKLADGFTKIGYHDLGPQSFTTEITERFKRYEEACVAIIPDPGDGLKGVIWSKVPCTDNHDLLCQYKKSCYKRSDYIKDPTRPIKRLIPLVTSGEDESGYFISTLQATWPFAKQVCEDADLSLLWFDDNQELNGFVERINAYRLENVQYIGKTYWTAGRFSPWNSTGDLYDKLYRWKQNTAFEVSGWNIVLAHSGQMENSGGFVKKWGKDPEALHLSKNEPYDEGLQGKERCVDLAIGDGVTALTSKCEKALRYFVCMDPQLVKQVLNRPDQAKPSRMEYCAGNKYYKTHEKDCNGEILFAGKGKPDCTCYKGVHLLISDMKCKPKLLVGTGCMKLKAKASLHWKILPSEIIHKNKPWIIVVYSSDDKHEMFDWFSVNLHESRKRQILGQATFYFSGFRLFRNSNTKTDDLCFVIDTNLPAGEYYEYNVDDLVSISMRYYNFPGANCKRTPIGKEAFIIHRVSLEGGKNECEISASCLDAADLEESELSSIKSEQQSSSVKEVKVKVKNGTGSGGTPDKPILLDLSGKSNGGEATESECVDGEETCDADIHQDGGVEPPNKKGKAEGDIEDVNDNVNRQLLIYAIEVAFPHYTGPTDTLTGPKNTWMILEKIFELAKQACIKIVQPEFLSRVMKYFRIAHFGENYGYSEYFTEAETKQAMSMLDLCHQRVMRFRDIDVEVDDCTGHAWKVALENKTKEIITRSSDDTGYQSVFHHHVMEATWDVIDLWNALCLGEFKSSYLLFHHIERGLEFLFNDKLRKLWHFPNVTEEYFQKLLGPDEGIQLLNLDQCVLAAYKGNARINRMSRPNRGMNTVVGKMIRNRLDDERLKDRGIPPSRFTNGDQGNFTTACMRGNTMRCHRRNTKNKKNRPSDLLRALSRTS